jgi:hypothetical protein
MRLLPLIIFALAASVAMATEPDTQTERLSSIVRALVAPAPRHRLHCDIAMAEFVRDAQAASAEAPDVSVEKLIAVAFLESSFDPRATGGIGEIGIMQIHGVAAQGCDLRTQRGQLICGARLLQSGIEECGSWRGSLTRYATGRCRSKSDRVMRIVNHRVRFAEKLEGE